MQNRKNWLITGGAGFIGGNFIHNLFNNHFDDIYSVVNYDSLTYASNPKFVDDLIKEKSNSSYYKFIKGDICNKEFLMHTILENNINVIVNFAAETHVCNSLLYPEAFMHSNVDGIFTILEILKELKHKHNKIIRFHHISTDEVFGSLRLDELPWTEESSYRPNSPYSATKASADMLIRSYQKGFGIDYTISYSSNNFGPNQHPEKLIPKTIKNFLEGLRVPIYGSGKMIRDWLFTQDNCEGILHIIKYGKLNETYCLSGNVNLNVNDIVKITLRKTNELMKHDGFNDFNPNDYMYQIEDPRGLAQDIRYEMSCKKLNDLGFSTNFGYKKFESDLEKTIQWYFNKC